MPLLVVRAARAILAAGVLAVLTALPAEAGPVDPPRWRPPLDGPLEVVRSFAPPATRFGSGHRGVDLAGSAGAPVQRR